MLTFDLLYQTIGAAYLAVLTYPNLPPDPTLIAQLEQAQPGRLAAKTVMRRCLICP